MSIELNILDWFQTLHTPFLDKLMVFITSLGNAGIYDRDDDSISSDS